jgi:hypothetical protein
MRRHPDGIFSRILKRSLSNLTSSVLSDAEKRGDLRIVQQRTHHSDPQIGKSCQNWKLAPNHFARQLIQDPGQNIGQATSNLPPEYNKAQSDWFCRGEVYSRQHLPGTRSPGLGRGNDAPPTPQRTQMWAQVAAEEEGVGARSLAHNT